MPISDPIPHAGMADSVKLRDAFDTLFLKHPRQAGESYLEHFGFAMKVAFYLLATAGGVIIHAIMPHFFQKTGSQRIIALADDLRRRQQMPR